MNADKLMMYQMRRADAPVIWVLFLFLGWSYGSLGRMGTQLLYYLTLGGFGIWWFIRLLTLQDAIDAYNYNIAKQVGMTPEEMVSLGIF